MTWRPRLAAAAARLLRPIDKAAGWQDGTVVLLFLLLHYARVLGIVMVS